MLRRITLSLLCLIWFTPANAAFVNLDINGVGSGSVGSFDFIDRPFVIDMQTDNNLFNGSEAQLTSAYFAVDNGIGSSLFLAPLKISIAGQTVLLSLASGDELLSLSLSPSDAALFSFQQGAVFLVLPKSGSSPSTNIVGVPTADGALNLSSLTNITFSGRVDGALAPGVPEPSTWALMILGFAGVSLWRTLSVRMLSD